MNADDNSMPFTYSVGVVNNGHTAAITLITMCQRFIRDTGGWVCVILYCAVWKTHVRPFNCLISHESPTRWPKATGHWDTVRAILYWLWHCLYGSDQFPTPGFETYSERCRQTDWFIVSSSFLPGASGLELGLSGFGKHPSFKHFSIVCLSGWVYNGGIPSLLRHLASGIKDVLLWTPSSQLLRNDLPLQPGIVFLVPKGCCVIHPSRLILITWLPLIYSISLDIKCPSLVCFMKKKTCTH